MSAESKRTQTRALVGLAGAAVLVLWAVSRKQSTAGDIIYPPGTGPGTGTPGIPGTRTRAVAPKRKRLGT